MKKTLSFIALFLSLVTILSFGSVASFATESSEASENGVFISADVSSEDGSADATSEDATSEEATSDDATSEDASSEDATSEEATSDDATSDDATSDDATSDDASSDAADDSADSDSEGSSFPWPLVIFLGLVAVFAVVCFICIKKENKFGIWLKNFFKDYKSEIKKITWPSREVTIKSTIVVLVCVLVCGVAISLLDFGLGKLVELLMDLAGK